MGIQYTAGADLSSAFIPTVFRANNLSALHGYLENYCPAGRVRVLDAGCGDGVHALYLAQAGISGEYIGVDVITRFSSTTWRSIPSTCKGLSAEFRILDAVKLSRDNLGEFHAIICLTTLEHIADYRQAVAAMSRLLAANGAIFITVPSSYTWLFSFGKHAHHYFRARDIETAAIECGLTVKKFRRLGGAPGFFFDLCYSWSMAVISQFTDPGAFVAAAPVICKKFHHALIRGVQRMDVCVPFLQSGYAYVLTKA